jgi:hypothetical protein
VDTPASASLTPAQARAALAWHRQRTARALRGIALVAIVFLLFHWLFVWVWVPTLLAYWWLGRCLRRGGVFVPCNVLGRLGEIERPASAGESWARANPVPPASGPETLVPVTMAFDSVRALTLGLGRIAPCVLVFSQYTLGGRTHRVGQYMFTTEAFVVDEGGTYWALVHPRFPRLNHWTLSRLPDAVPGAGGGSGWREAAAS